MEALFLIGRIVFGLFFTFNGLNHFMRMGMMKQYAASKGTPAPGLAVALTGLMLLAGALSILLGYYIWIGSIILIVFLVPTALIMHRFWGLEDPNMAMVEMTQFMKNFALAGGALMLLYYAWTYGSGPLSLGP